MAVQGIEKRTVSITQQLDGIPDFPGLKTLIRVDSERPVDRANIIEASQETRYYVASFVDTAEAFTERIRGYWGVENKVVHYVWDMTQKGEMPLTLERRHWCKVGLLHEILR